MGSYESFRDRYPVCAQECLDVIRESCLSFGDAIVEDVRLHRIVYGKGMVQRWFADVYPEQDQVTVRVQRNWRQKPQTHTIPYGQDITVALEAIHDAYDLI